MFPLGAMQISEAIKNERSAQAANTADNLFRLHWRRFVVEAIKNGATERQLVDPNDASGRYLHFMAAMENPNINLTNDVAPVNVLPNRASVLPPLSDPTTWITDPNEIGHPSYPVFVDPYGELSRRSPIFVASRRWVGGVHNDASGALVSITPKLARIPRRTLNFPGVQAFYGTSWPYRMSTLLDDLKYSDNGVAGMDLNDNAVPVVRNGRYNWAWMLQRPNQGNRLYTNLTIVVYDERTFDYARPDGEISYDNTAFTVGSTQIAIPYDLTSAIPTQPPALRAGNWILDSTILPANNAVSPVQPAIRNGNFYRVVSVTDVPGATAGTGQMVIDLQTPIKAPTGYTAASYVGQLTVLRGVAEVFERRPLLLDDTPDLP
jgi:hypothetical protein